MVLCSLIKTYYSFGRICHMPEESGTKFLRNDITFTSNYMAAYPIRQHCWKTAKFTKTPERKHVLRNITALMSQDNVVGTMSRLWTEQLRNRDSFPGSVKASDRPLRPTQLPVQYVPGLKRRIRADDRSPPPTAQIKNTCSHTSIRPYSTMTYTRTFTLY